ncbi:MAG: tRNA (adenosine(37)-N6)-dimethylallyltransferase MiaA [Armatimonadota bacterium]|nr:tRNA (adenosine(37)-N6)-dimethylallyltransferase MiaA [Armatimonadota bacterium]MDR7427035.1 tRNA (adenosine(37)-N6)-dimethylallyltransferase MiaA [Armatimonadota bacterium]MDR7468753.1 tRNA (adenosine(37)-N6)-dimethylallyltransferase MiaA [Armatimonadota bacterium]MDR7474803.1 tRNA (adenosine(37)-N6)-dimethylallyltransferase MiaA [Armatimonadota bacterium]MDR7538580.1 tRNA (adenosine(37)-N6)-dimethylallyltransferase MiaA [Armatimonadota bacterium]
MEGTGEALLVVICGATATGKTAVAAALAAEVGGEIVAADSRTVYRGMDIGTAKPPPGLRAAVPHHLLDVAEPTEVFTLAQYQRMATSAITDILRRGRLPLLVGGTGLYIRAVVDGLQIPRVPPDWAFRRQAEAQEQAAPGILYARLQRLDPLAAQRIHPHNLRRVIRALEVIAATGRPVSEQQEAQPGPWRVLIAGLWVPRPLLYRRIDHRVDEQLAQGLVREVEELLARGVPPQAPAMQGLGYKEIIPYLQGRSTLAEAVAALKRNTRRFARRQESWFRRDPRIRWIDAGEAAPETVASTIRAMLAEE